jgi:hypothetical protein
VHSLIRSKTLNGDSWTLTTRLGNMLNLAQAAYGPRDDSYTILGIEFVENNPPQIWYPGNCKHIAIQLTPDTITNQLEGCYQLAHECIHLLSPSGGCTVNVLEEGLATYFAHQYVEKEFNFTILPTIKSYEIARQLVHKLLKFDADAVKKIRKSQFAISKITSENILEVVPQFNLADAQVLEREFVR